MIHVEGLSKHFGPVIAVDDASFSVPSCSICGFIGPNGAGKTTTLRILATLDVPTTGEAFINGHNVRDDPAAVRREIGYMPDYYGTYPALNVAEYLDFFARAYRLSAAVRQRRLAEIVAFTELTGLLDRPVEGLSKGQKQRLSMARALLPDPSVLILDEPAAGLDPRARIELRELLKMLAQQGKAIFMSSHILTELADLVDRVVIIDQGSIRYSGPLETLSNGTAEGTGYVLELTGSETEARKFLLEQPAVLEVDGAADGLYVRLNETVETAEDFIARMIAAGFRLRQFYRHQQRLEDVFMAVTTEERKS